MAQATFKRTGFGNHAVYTCSSCKKQTRETGQGESGCDLCAKCYDEAGWENSHTDGNHDCGSEPDFCPACRPGYTGWACDPTNQYHNNDDKKETTVTTATPTKPTTKKATKKTTAKKPATKKAAVLNADTKKAAASKKTAASLAKKIVANIGPKVGAPSLTKAAKADRFDLAAVVELINTKLDDKTAIDADGHINTYDALNAVLLDYKHISLSGVELLVHVGGRGFTVKITRGKAVETFAKSTGSIGEMHPFLNDAGVLMIG